MARLRHNGTIVTALIAASVALAGCSGGYNGILSSLSGEKPEGGTKTEIAPSKAEMQATPVSATVMTNADAFTTVPLPGFTESGTEVGRKAAQLHDELGQLNGKVQSEASDLDSILTANTAIAQNYHGIVAAISARLQVGTTPGNPILVSQWNEAQAQLDQISQQIGKLNKLSNDVAASSTVGAYLLDSVRATLGLSGAVEEDHRQLSLLEDRTNQTVVLIQRLLMQTTDEMQRSTDYVAAERRDLQSLSLAISKGEAFGSSLANRAYFRAQEVSASGAAPMAAAPLAGVAQDDNRRPLVVIRFERDDVDYEQAVYQAVSKALERKPDARFDVVAVSPANGSPADIALTSTSAKRNAEGVMRSLVRLGLPAERITLSARSSAQAQTSEVHIYVH
jgi:outer membrane murein-binding lipoprotein Lpp